MEKEEFSATLSLQLSLCHGHKANPVSWESKHHRSFCDCPFAVPDHTLDLTQVTFLTSLEGAGREVIGCGSCLVISQCGTSETLRNHSRNNNTAWSLSRFEEKIKQGTQLPSPSRCVKRGPFSPTTWSHPDLKSQARTGH